MNSQLNNKFKKAISRLLYLLKEKANLFLLSLLIASFFGAGLIFYLFVFKAQNIVSPPDLIKIKNQLYQQVIDRLNARETNIQQGISQDCRDVFR